MNIVDRIKELCSERSLTIASLERTLNIGNGVIRRWGNVNPRADLVAKIADYFSVTSEYLLNGTTSDPHESDIVGGEDETYRILHRRIKRLTPEQRRRFNRVGEEMFDDFKD